MSNRSQLERIRNEGYHDSHQFDVSAPSRMHLVDGLNYAGAEVLGELSGRQDLATDRLRMSEIASRRARASRGVGGVRPPAPVHHASEQGGARKFAEGLRS